MTSGLNLPTAYRIASGGSNKCLAIQIKGAFNITQAGEFSFTPAVSAGTYTSAAVSSMASVAEFYDAEWQRLRDVLRRR